MSLNHLLGEQPHLDIVVNSITVTGNGNGSLNSGVSNIYLWDGGSGYCNMDTAHSHFSWLQIGNTITGSGIVNTTGAGNVVSNHNVLFAGFPSNFNIIDYGSVGLVWTGNSIPSPTAAQTGLVLLGQVNNNNAFLSFVNSNFLIQNATFADISNSCQFRFTLTYSI